MGRCSESHCLSHVLHVHITCRCVLKDKLNVPLSTLHDLMSCYRLTRHQSWICTELYRLTNDIKLMVNGYVLPSHVCRIIIHVLCLARSTVVLVTTDLSMVYNVAYIHYFGISHNSKT